LSHKLDLKRYYNPFWVAINKWHWPIRECHSWHGISEYHEITHLKYAKCDNLWIDLNIFKSFLIFRLSIAISTGKSQSTAKYSAKGLFTLWPSRRENLQQKVTEMVLHTQ
jgi:hypothetical protein